MWPDFILNSYLQGLRSQGETEEALIVEILRDLNEPAHLTAYSKDEALSISLCKRIQIL